MPPKDYSMDDLLIFNQRDRTTDVTVTLIPEGRTEPTMDLSIRLSSDEKITWEDNPLLNEAGRVIVTVDDGENETERKEDDWWGDTSDDNRRLVIYVEEEGISIKQHSA